ncbi:hypothetical protein [Virgibacillus sp. L01]|uniref:hypothetical protein n=1 Tax=Virgibacillus sp. L01 TaxID=3457429 RepID=UPI003FD3D000
MVKSVKGQFIISLLVAIGFLMNSFSYIKFTGEAEFMFNRKLFYFVMIISVFSAGLLTQKYIQTKRKDNNSPCQGSGTYNDASKNGDG